MSAVTNPLSRMLVDAWQKLRTAYDEIASYRELLLVALALLSERDRQLDASRRSNLHLRNQLREASFGRTDAEERQQQELDDLGDAA